MQYVLGLGILCKKYKKNPNIRVFADDTFIDEFEITHGDETKKFTDISKNCKMTKNWSAKHFHILHIDEKHLNSKISIRVQNDDSNYTNSFMSKSTVIAFDSIFLIPKHFLDNNCKVYGEIYDKWHRFKWKLVCKIYNLPYEQVAYNLPLAYKIGKTLGDINMDGYKGGNTTFTKFDKIKPAQEVMKEQNIQKRAVHWPMVKMGLWNKTLIEHLDLTWLGGSGICDLYIKEYHGIRMFTNDVNDHGLRYEDHSYGLRYEDPAPIPSIFNLDSKKIKQIQMGWTNIYGINLTERFLHISYLLFKNDYAKLYYQ